MIHAVLGPTNTGKTHVAIQRMLGHRSGMIGLPLRLLAREVYDRVVRSKGPDAVALLTGEEKILPERARYWVCTVESMPTDKPVDFLAVDEIQLAADPERGHVFTDRLLNARGANETWFLGAETIAPLLHQLVPTAVVRTQPRLSELRWSGTRKLLRLPPRSAVVGFTMQRVYELAERLRARHGGTAVVLGALSPRTRNAQVEMYQSGEVDFMVATDAIGMGLNMDVTHVAMADLSKFDGRQWRELRSDELGQIAGRAGRYRTDGTFGVTAGAEEPPPEVIEAITQHQFPPLKSLMYRNSQLDYTSGAALLESLLDPPKHRFLKVQTHAMDSRVLELLVADEEITQTLTGEAEVRRLWELCGVPDFGNTTVRHHADFLKGLWLALIDGHGVLPESMVKTQVRRLDNTDGPISTLMGRLAGIRSWTFLSHKADWLDDPGPWRDLTASVEDRLSDALHRKLTARFVDTRATRVRRQLNQRGDLHPEVAPGGRVLLADANLGRLVGLDFQWAEGTRANPWLAKEARRVVRPLLVGRLQSLEEAHDGAFGVDPEGFVRWDGARLALLERGREEGRPSFKLLRLEWLEGAERQRVHRRIEGWLQRWLIELRCPWPDPPTASLRALCYALERSLGIVSLQQLTVRVKSLKDEERQWLRDQGIVIGWRWVYHREVFRRTRHRILLQGLWTGQSVSLPDDDGELPFATRLPPKALTALGFERVEGYAIRADLYEAILRKGASALSGMSSPPKKLEQACQRLRRPSRRRRRHRR